MDYYETLGIGRDASESAIKKAYRELSFKNHPDRNSSPDATVKIQKINEAYETLKDDQKRAAYDRYGHDSYKSSGGGFNPNQGHQQSGGNVEIIHGIAWCGVDLIFIRYAEVRRWSSRRVCR